MNLPDGTPVVGWSWPPAPVADRPIPCRCGHLLDMHGLDRKRRAICRGSTVCGCSHYRLPELTKDTA